MQILETLEYNYYKNKNIKTVIALVNNPLVAFTNFKNSFSIILAAGGLVTDTKGRCLMIKRLGYWDLPKGKIDDDETPEIAAIREVKEETGINSISIIKQIDSSHHVFIENKNNWVFKTTYWFIMMGTESILKPQIEENITKVAWLSPNQIKIREKSTYASVFDILKNAGFHL